MADCSHYHAHQGLRFRSSEWIISENEINLKQVVNTNKCMLHLTIINGKLLITSIIDNLIKGASGQAIQNMNLMFGLKETEGLRLKSSIF